MSMIRPDKIAAQQEIEEKLAAFLKTGGKIKNVPAGATGSSKQHVAPTVNYFQNQASQEIKKAKR